MRWLDEIRFGSDGLVPVIAQDAASGAVLMLAYANRDALERTAESGAAHYWSRSRGSLWEKGATSGHRQRVLEIRTDCDGDAVLYRVDQTGPACHTMERSCFHRSIVNGALEKADTAEHVLSRVDGVIQRRHAERPAESYTTYLFESGLDKILKKLGEEATETVIAAKNGDADELRKEVADLIFHLLVLLRERDLPLEQVWSELEHRYGRSSRVPAALRSPDHTRS